MSKNLQLSARKSLVVLIGFPIVSYLLSLLLLRKNWFSEIDLDFFTVFWTLICLWYVIQIFITKMMLNTSGLVLSDIGYTFNKKKTICFIIGYLIFAFSIFGFVEFALSSANLTEEDFNRLSDFSNLTPKTTGQRIIFIFAGLFAGLAEELVYRGFAIKALEEYNINKWVAVVLAAIPFVFQHGLKSLDQFWWFFISGLIFGVIYLLTKKRLYVVIVLHWLMILSAMLAILQLLE